jgi:hypothetical protein
MTDPTTLNLLFLLKFSIRILSEAHFLDPNTIPEYLWRQGTLYDPSNDELVMSPFPNLPEDTYLVNAIPSVNSDENISEILAVKVEE